MGKHNVKFCHLKLVLYIILKRAIDKSLVGPKIAFAKWITIHSPGVRLCQSRHDSMEQKTASLISRVGNSMASVTEP